jgi:hypothetical protein
MKLTDKIKAKAREPYERLASLSLFAIVLAVLAFVMAIGSVRRAR